MGADFAHSAPVIVDTDGSLAYLPIDLAQPALLRVCSERGGWNAISLTGAAHTLDAYRRLPHGWRPAPPGGLERSLHVAAVRRAPRVSVGGPCTRLTHLHLAAVDRRMLHSWNERVAELERWRTARPVVLDFELELDREVAIAVRDAANSRELRSARSQGCPRGISTQPGCGACGRGWLRYDRCDRCKSRRQRAQQIGISSAHDNLRLWQRCGQASWAWTRRSGIGPTVTAEGVAIQELIDGVSVRRPPTHVDHRGSICEVYDVRWGFTDDEVVYVYYVTVTPGQVKGWVLHMEQNDRMFVYAGVLRVILFDGRARIADVRSAERLSLRNTRSRAHEHSRRRLSRCQERGRNRGGVHQPPVPAVPP